MEVDGGQHDASSQREAQRSAFLEAEGYRILRLWNNEALANREGVEAVIAAALGISTLTQPSPVKGEGFSEA